MKARDRWALVALLLLAFGLRLYELDGQSLWSDEGLTFFRSALDVATIVDGVIAVDGVPTQDTNPPLYFLLLHGWRQLAGDSVFALRAFGVFAGLLSLPWLYRLTGTLIDRHAALLATLLLALSPFHVWQSQELRNYSLLLLFNLISVAGLAAFLFGRGRRRDIVLWLLAGLLGIYTHYFGLFVFAFGVAMLVLAGARRRRWLTAALAAGALAMLPVLLYGFNRFRAGPQIDFVPVAALDVVSHMVSVYSVGIIPGVVQPVWRASQLLVLVIAGVLLWWRKRPFAFTAAYLAIPIAILLLLSQINPLYNGPRHLLIGLPPFLIVAAAGVRRAPGVWRWPALALLIGALAIQAFWLNVQYHDSELVKDDIRGVAHYLSRVATADDVIVLHDTLIRFTFDVYYDGAAPVTAVPHFAEHDPDRARAELAAAATGARRLWFLTEPHPRSGFDRTVLAEWALAEWKLFAERRFPDLWLPVNLVGLAPEVTVETLPPEATAVGAAWPGVLTLAGARVQEQVTAGEDLWLDLFWRDTPAPRGAWQLSLRLLADDGTVWAQVDRPFWPDFPPDRWPAGGLVRHPFRFPVPGGVPPGDYHVSARLLPDRFAPPLITATGETAVNLARVAVTATTADEIEKLPRLVPADIRWSVAELRGFVVPEGPYRPGHAVPLTLLWRARDASTEPLELVVQLVDRQEMLAAETLISPTRVDHPTTRWEAGQWLQGQATLTLPAGLRDGHYQLRVGLRAPDGRFLDARDRRRGESGPLITLWSIFVEPWPFESSLPPLPSDADLRLGEPVAIRLAAYDVGATAVAPGASVDVTLGWRAEETVTTRYHVFLHLVDQSGAIVAQSDAPPLGGVRPTTSWRAGEAFADTHTLTIPPDVLPGDYTMFVGLYDPATGIRPPAAGPDGPLPDGRFPLTTLTVTTGP